MVIIEGKIRGKQRPRLGNGHAYTPKQTKAYEKLVRINYLEQGGEYLGEGAMSVFITAYFKIPTSCSKKEIREIMEKPIHPTKYVDADNIAKIILDALNGVAYKDDKQVVDLTVLKRYTDGAERVEVEISELL